MSSTIRHRTMLWVMRPRDARRMDRAAGATPTTTCDTPRQEILPARGVVFSSEVQCPLDTVTAFPSHVRRAESFAAFDASNPPSRSERSSSPRCATAAGGACTAPSRLTSRARRSTTSILSPKAARTSQATSLPHVRRAIASRRTCSQRNSSCATPPPAATSFTTRAPYTGRSNDKPGAP